MLRIGITYNPSTDLFYSGYNQTALLLTDVFLSLNYEVTLINSKNTEDTWWSDFPRIPGVHCCKLLGARDIDYLIDIDGYVPSELRKTAAKCSIVFLRTFLQFSELDDSVYPEKPYMPRDFEGVNEIWCWDILNPADTIPSIQTLFSCPIRTVPFIWSPRVAEHYAASRTPKYNETVVEWTVHIAEKNRDNSSSAVIPLVAVRELTLKNILNAKYKCHNMEGIRENRFLIENVLKNIDCVEGANKLPIEFSKRAAYYEWCTEENSILFTHSRFTGLRVGLLNAIWMGIPVIHNSPVLQYIHPALNAMSYFGNQITGMTQAFKQFVSNPMAYYSALKDIRCAISSHWSPEANLTKWRELCSAVFITTALPPVTTATSLDSIVIAFSDMWPGFNYDSNLITDAVRHECSTTLKQPYTVKGIEYSTHGGPTPHLLIFGPYSYNWKNVPKHIPKVFFSGENWKQPEDTADIKLLLTSSRTEDERHIRIPTWMTFIDWFSGSKEFPKDSTDNPIRIPLHFAMTPHPTCFKKRERFCGFVVSNPICTFRNEVFKRVNSYKQVTSGGALYNNIGGQLALKYPGGGSGDISKYEFFSEHRFTISFENSQSAGYITEKVLHAKIAGCVPLYWGDAETDIDFVPNSFINLSVASDPEHVLAIVRKLEENEEVCSIIAATPILNEEKAAQALKGISKMATRLLTLAGVRIDSKKSEGGGDCAKSLDRIDKVFVINLDHRQDRWNNLLKAEPGLEKLLTRVSGVDGKTLKMTPFIHKLFNKNCFQWKKSIIGCYLSHIKVWSQILSESGEYFLVLEDDVRFTKGWMKTWKRCAEQIPQDADLLYLGGVLPPNKRVLPHCLENVNSSWCQIKLNTCFSSVPLPVFHFCAYSYILTKKGAQKLLTYLVETGVANYSGCDHLLGSPFVGLNRYVVNPLLSYCFQEDDPVYINSQFNDLQRNDTFDSDIWNNTDCFLEHEIAAANNTLDKCDSGDKMVLYYAATVCETGYELYETEWLEALFGCKFHFMPLTDFDKPVLTDGAWFIVQRPHLDKWITYFDLLDSRGINFNVLHLSDEFCKDSVAFYTLPYCRAVIRTYCRKDVSGLSHVLTIPLGYHFTGATANNFADRKLAWSFHGTDWFGRRENLQLLSEIQPNSCHLTPTWNHSTMTGRDQYLSVLSESRFCPIMRGNNVETFRLYECIEMGAIPVYVRERDDELFWSSVLVKLGIVELDSWSSAAQFMKQYEANPDAAEKYRRDLAQKWNNLKLELTARISQIKRSVLVT